jgi:hypothetical protein
MIFICPYMFPKFDFWKQFCIEVWDANESELSFPFILHSFYVFGEYVESLSVYGEYGEFRLFAVYEVVSEYAERIYAHMERTPRETKLVIS